MAENKDIWEGLQNRRLQEHDVVTLKQTVTLEDLKARELKLRLVGKELLLHTRTNLHRLLNLQITVKNLFWSMLRPLISGDVGFKISRAKPMSPLTSLK
jgi:hypothetical protein